LNNPAGRLPVTFYRGIEQLPLFEDYSMKNRTYRYFFGDPLYPFGYGLSYAHYSYANLKLSKAHLDAGDSLAVELDVTNESQRAGDEVVELYLNFPPTAGAPIRALRGFERVHLTAGSTRHVHLDLNDRDLSLVNESGDRIIVPGDYGLSIGGGQPGSGAAAVQTSFSIRGRETLPE
jgi:beta-glucosidase